MKTSKLLLAMVLLGTPCWQGCLTAWMWGQYHEEQTVTESVRADVEGLYEVPARYPGGTSRLVLHCRLTDPVAAEASEISPFEGVEGCIGIEAVQDEVTAVVRELEAFLALNCCSVDSIAGDLRLNADAGTDDGAEMVLVLSADTGMNRLQSETFQIRGRWYPVDPSKETGLRSLLDARSAPSDFRLVRCRVESNSWILALLTPLTLGADGAIVAGCVACLFLDAMRDLR